MKKLVSLILISVIIIGLSVNVFATGFTPITGEQYEEAQGEDKDDTDKGDNNTTLPQTGVENYGLGALLVVFAASAIFAYKKVSDYRDIK